MPIVSRLSVYWLVILTSFAAVFLCWGFAPLSVVEQVGGSLLIVLSTIFTLWRWQRKQRVLTEDLRRQLLNLPQDSFAAPVVLVCGDGLDHLFADGSSIRLTPQGCYLRLSDQFPLVSQAQAILALRPGWKRQLTLTYQILPESQTDESTLRVAIKHWRQQVSQLQAAVGHRLPLAICCYLNGPSMPWCLLVGDKNTTTHQNSTGKNHLIVENGHPAQPLSDWLASPKMAERAERAAILPGLSVACDWLNDLVFSECRQSSALSTRLQPMALMVRFMPLVAIDNNLWHQRLAQQTTLAGLAAPTAHSALTASGLPFPDPLLILFSRVVRPAQRGQTLAASLIIVSGFSLLAIGCVLLNNQRLITQVGADLQRYYAIPMSHTAPKLQAVTALKQHAQLLENYYRQGEPLRLGLGLNQNPALYLALQKAIDGYIPPTEPIIESTATLDSPPQTLRLDALSLFDVGKSTLKAESTKVLVDALFTIRAKPGWLVVISGHTDNTGNTDDNQRLSLKRAEALRDWILHTSDVSPTCFAVQGFGASRPIATNDTQEGRAANRRVEISLLPQVDACQTTIELTSPQGEAIIPHFKEQ